MSKIIPIINGDKGNTNIIESNLPTLSSENSKNLVPILNNNNELILEMNGIGPMGLTGPKGDPGNGIVKIEKTSSSGAIDTYTIFFTDGSKFNYNVTNAIIRYYNGPYEVTPSIYSQILSTENLEMLQDVYINEIPYYEVSNSSGGYTATIGDNI